MQSLKYYVSHRNDFITGVIRKCFGESGILPSKMYLKLLFRVNLGYRLDLKRPKTFNQKIQWLKLHDRNPRHTVMVDKLAVKDYVAKRIGANYVIPLATTESWKKFDDIDFDRLPDSFVLKTTHSGGNLGVIIVKDKNTFNKERAKQILDSSLKKNIYPGFREWPYKNVEPRIFAEKLLETPDGDLKDYKIFCFNGEPKFLFVASDRQASTETCFDFYDIAFNHIPVKNGHPNAHKKIEKPLNWDKMLLLARQLSKDEKFVRVDLYNVRGKIYFGEYTFFHNSGLVPFEPIEWDYKFGEALQIPNISDK